MIFPSTDAPTIEPKPTALYSAISSESASNSWTSVNGWVVPRQFTSLEEEYASLTQEVAVADFGPLSRYIIRGSMCVEFLARVTTAPLSSLVVGENARGLILASSGAVADIIDVARLGEEMYLLSTSQPHARRLQLAMRGFDVSLEDITGRIAALALIGPKAAEAAQAAGLSGDSDMTAAQTVIRGVETATRPINVGVQPGVEIIYPNDEALTIWERVRRAASPKPVGLDAFEVLRIEAGAPRPGVDFISADKAMTPDMLRTPSALGLPHLAPLNRAWFNGRRALQGTSHAPHGSIKTAPARQHLTIALDAETIFSGATVFSGDATVGFVTSAAYSPRMRRVVAFIDVDAASARGPFQVAGCLPGERLAAELHESAEARLALAFTASMAAATESRN